MRPAVVIASCLAVWLPAVAPRAQTAAPPPRPNCSQAQMRQLDFWVGDWEVSQTGDSQVIASSKIEKLYGGCAIKETYDAPRAPGGAYGGTSYSGWDRKDERWHQMYVDTNGNVTWYTGGLEGVDMVLTAAAANGAVQKMTYHPLPGGAVEQVGLISTDEGRTWQASYDYTYRRAK